MRRMFCWMMIWICLSASTAAAQKVGEPLPVRPVTPLPPITLPLPQPPPLTPTLPTPTIPAPTLTAPVQVIPPAPPAAGSADGDDGSQECDCYVTENVPVIENGVVVRTQTTSRWMGKSKQCCPQPVR